MTFKATLCSVQARRLKRLTGRLVVAAVLVSCSSTSDVSPAILDTAPADVVARFRLLTDRVESAVGSVRSRLALDEVRNAELQQLLRDCMDKSGFDYISAEVGSASRSLDLRRVLFEWWWTPDIVVARARAYGVMWDPTLDPGYSPSATTPDSRYGTMRPAERAAYDAALSSCERDVEGKTSQDPSQAANSLYVTLDESVTRAVASASFAQPLSKYVSCMSSAGYKIDSISHIYTDILEPYISELDLYGKDPASDDFANALQKGRDFERRVAIADVSCRVAIATEILDQIEPAIEQWEQKYAIEVAETTAEWKHITSD